MKCIREDRSGNIICICCCYSRQVRGCRDASMEIADEVTEKIEKLDWNKVIVCTGINEEAEDSRICVCLSLRCDDNNHGRMKQKNMSKSQVIEYIEAMLC